MQQQGELPTPRPVIIVVDDDRAVRNSLKFSLELEGFSVHAYGCGGDLLGSATAFAGACLVVDQNMPGMTGLDLIARLRARNVSTPAILITTHPGARLKERAAQAHVPIVEKPLLGNGLVDTIRDACAPQNGHRL
jgi:two-component system, LuxR family, response regulator FixJ